MQNSNNAEGRTLEEGWVYFARAANGLVKIGYSRHDPESRVQAIATSSPVAVQFLAALSGGRQLERALHFFYLDGHVRGEWFQPPHELLRILNAQDEWEMRWWVYDVLLKYEDAGRPAWPLRA